MLHSSHVTDSNLRAEEEGRMKVKMRVTKGKFCKMVVRPVMICGSETVVLTKTMERGVEDAQILTGSEQDEWD